MLLKRELFVRVGRKDLSEPVNGKIEILIMFEIEFTNNIKRNFKHIQKRGYDISLLFDLIQQLNGK